MAQRDVNSVRVPQVRSFVLAFLLFLLYNVAVATHEADHRYNVKGFVLNKNEEPVAGSPISIRLGSNVIGYQKTNSQGYYSIRLHLHDADFGKILKVQTATGEASIQVTFTRGDKTTNRVHYANLIGDMLVERQLSRFSFPIWGYAAGAATVILAVTAIVVGTRIRRRQKRQLAKERKHKKRKRR